MLPKVDNSIDLEDTLHYCVPSRPRVYIASCITHPENRHGLQQLNHVANRVFRSHGFDPYTPAEHTGSGSPHLPSEVYLINCLEVMQSDLIFFIRTERSHGLGVEAKIAADVLVPWGDAKLREDHRELTPMLYALANDRPPRSRIIFDQGDVAAFEQELTVAVEDPAFRDFVVRCHHMRVAVRDSLQASGIGRAVRRQRLLLDMPIETLAALTDVAPHWLSSLERDELLVGGLSLLALMRIADATRSRFVRPQTKGPAWPRLIPKDRFRQDVYDAADEFAAYSLRKRQAAEPGPESDGEMLSQWHTWLTSKGIGPSRTHKDKFEAVSKLNSLRGHLFVPMSNLDAIAQPQTKSVRNAICAALKDCALKVDVFDPSTNTPPSARAGAAGKGHELSLKARARLFEYDFALVIADPPATGVGVMIQTLMAATMPVFIIAPYGVNVSRMLRGVPARTLTDTIRYAPSTGNLVDLEEQIKRTIATHGEGLLKSAERRRRAYERVMQTRERASIHAFRIVRGLSINKLKARTCVQEDWFMAIADDPTLAATLTVFQMLHLADRLGWGIGVAETGVPHLCPPVGNLGPKIDRYRKEVEQSLNNLAACIAESPGKHTDDKVFEAWRDYLGEVGGDEFSGQVDKVRTIKKWQELLAPPDQGVLFE